MSMFIDFTQAILERIFITVQQRDLKYTMLVSRAGSQIKNLAWIFFRH